MEQFIDGEEVRDDQFDDDEEPMTAQKVSICSEHQNTRSFQLLIKKGP